MSVFDWKKSAPKIDLESMKHAQRSAYHSTKAVQKMRSQGIDPGRIYGLSKNSDSRVHAVKDFAIKQVE